MGSDRASDPGALERGAGGEALEPATQLQRPVNGNQRDPRPPREPREPSMTAVAAADEATRTLPGADFGAIHTAPLSALPETPALPRGAMLGRYVVLDELGAGGMGVVYAAYDPELGRKVAIKVLQSHLSVTPEGRLRLLREAQALARLSHPNVVAVHDVGAVEDQVFIAMELVEGELLGTWMREKRRPWRAVLEAFAAAGRGLAAAHAAGVVHRDFKPSNVLVSTDGRIRVMDFGLARSGDGEAPREDERTSDGAARGAATSPSSSQASPSALTTELTVTGSVLGTPKYLPPEAYNGITPGPAGDQFAFCAALYEALWGQPPFALDAPPTSPTRWAVREPARSSVPRWVARLVLRGLAAAPEARHPSMTALVAALGSDPGARRRQVVAATVLVAIVAGLWGASRLSRARAIEACAATADELAAVWNEPRAEAIGRAFARSGAPYAAPTWRWARTELDSYAKSWGETRVSTCLQAEVHTTIADSLAAATRACLGERREELSALLEQLEAPDHTTLQRAAAALAALPPPASCSDAARLRHQAEPPGSDRDRAIVAELRALLARAASENATAHHERGQELAERVLARATEVRWPPVALEAELVLADALFGSGQFDRARAVLEEAFFSASASGRDELALRAATKLVIVVGHRLARPEEGLRWARFSEMLFTRLARSEDLLLATLLNNQAVVRGVGLGDHERAITLLERAAKLREALLGPKHPLLAMSLGNWGLAYVDRGDYARARPLLERALEIRQASLGEDHPDTALALSNLGNVLSALGEHERASTYLERALASRQQSLGANHPDVADLLNKLGRAHTRAGKPAAALPLHARALEVQGRTYGDAHPVYADTLAALGRAHLAMHLAKLALPEFERALAIRRAALSPDHPDLAEGYRDLAQGQLALGQAKAAAGSLAQSLALLGARTAPPVELEAIRLELAHALWLAGERDRALGTARQAQAALATMEGPAPVPAEVNAWLAEHAGPISSPAPSPASR